MISLSHLHLSCRADTDVILDGHHAGNNLRNALANVMRYATCPETHRRGAPSAEHAATCPACWLLAAEADPGSVARAYALEPPRPPIDRVRAGETFSFGLTLFGDGFRFLPYVVLATAEMGRVGVGPGRRDGLGRFHLETIHSHNPLTGETHQLLSPGDPLVRVTPAAVTFDHAAAQAAALADCLRRDGQALRIDFLSPTRLEEKDDLYKIPDFAVFFGRLLWRIDDLALNFCGGTRRDPDEVAALRRAAERVRLVESRTRWVEMWSWSGRKQDRTPIGGFVGRAVYRAEDWTPLLPWLILGQGTHVGKTPVKGNGVYEIANLESGYWALNFGRRNP